MASSSADSHLDEFARIYPRSVEAEDAFDLVYDDTDLSEHHRSFYCVARQTRSRDSDSENSSSNRHKPPAPEHWAGYYNLSLQDPVKGKTSIGWRMGKGFSGTRADSTYGGDHGVDLILIRPGKRSNQTAPVHARIQFHPRSGVLMLVGVEKNRPIYYKTHDASSPLQLGENDGHVLYQISNIFWVGRLQYDLVLTILKDNEFAAFVGKRNALLYGPEASISGLLPHHGISATPRGSDIKRGSVIAYGMMGYGGFGRVFSAVDAETGEPLAVERHAPTTKHQLRAITLEADIAIKFKLNDGLLPTLGHWCEHDPNKPCDRVPQDIFTSSPLAIWDFSQVPWERCTNRQILEAFYGPLQGLVHLHADGIIHRDVTLKNMFVMSLNPIRAALGDFGKAIRAQKHQNASIGPADTRAPEVNSRTEYDNKIDVWSIGWAFIYVCLPAVFPHGSEPFVLQTWHKKVMEILESTSVTVPWYSKLSELLTGMLALDSARRISAAQALSQVSSLLTCPPPPEMGLPVPQATPPQMSLSRDTSGVSDLAQRDFQLEPNGCPYTVVEHVSKDPKDKKKKKARLL